MHNNDVEELERRGKEDRQQERSETKEELGYGEENMEWKLVRTPTLNSVLPPAPVLVSASSPLTNPPQESTMPALTLSQHPVMTSIRPRSMSVNADMS
jgi:hypothetical protein